MLFSHISKSLFFVVYTDRFWSWLYWVLVIPSFSVSSLPIIVSSSVMLHINRIIWFLAWLPFMTIKHGDRSTEHIFDWLLIGLHRSLIDLRSSDQPFIRGAPESTLLSLGLINVVHSPSHSQFEPELPNWKLLLLHHQLLSRLTGITKSSLFACRTQLRIKRHGKCPVHFRPMPPTKSVLLHRMVKCPR